RGARETGPGRPETGAPHSGEVHVRAVGPRQLFEEFDTLARGPDLLQPRLHVDGADVELFGAVRRAILDAAAAAGAVLDIDLEGVAGVGAAAGIDRRGLGLGRRPFRLACVVALGGDDALRAGDGDLAALDAADRIPDRHF